MVDAPMRRNALGIALLLSFAASGCGHPATRAECETILRKSAELKLRERTDDEAAIRDQVEAFTQSHGEELIAKCQGRTMTDAAMRCVQRAESAAAVDQCLY